MAQIGGLPRGRRALGIAGGRPFQQLTAADGQAVERAADGVEHVRRGVEHEGEPQPISVAALPTSRKTRRR